MRKFASIAFAGVSLLAIAQPAMAQDEPAPQSGETAEASEEIIVTARRRDESIQDVPATVNAVTAETIDKLNLRNFSDIQAVVPGLTLSGGGSFSTQATVRGVAFNPEANGNNATVEFYLNDTPIASNFLFQSMFDVGQFELLRGPQGTLRGRASPSGSITVTTRKPDLDEVGVVANGTITDTHAYKGDLALNVPIIRDVFGVRIAGVVDLNEGNRVDTIKRITDPAHNEDPRRRTFAVRVSARFEPTDWISFNGMFQTLRHDNHQYGARESVSLVTGGAQPAGVPLIRAFDRLSDDDVGAYNWQQMTVFNWSADIRQWGQRLVYVGSHNVQDFTSLGPNDGGDYFNTTRFALRERTPTDPAGAYPACGVNLRETGATANNHNYFQCTRGKAVRDSHEVRLQSEEPIAGIFDYVVGALFDKNDTPSRLTQETPLLAAPTVLASLNLTPIVRDGWSKETSFFANLTAHLGDRAEISGGVRRIKYKTFGSLLVNNARPTPDTLDKYTATIFNASAKYRFSDDLMVYATVGTSWRPGVRAIGDFSIQQSAREQSFINLDPEKSTSYEAGIKASFLDKRGRFNLSAYHQTFDGYTYRGPGVFYVNYAQRGPFVVPSVSSFNFVSSVPVTVNGFEAEASFQITPRWSIGGNFSYADGKIKNGVVACNDLNGDGTPDLSPPTPTLPQLLGAVGANNVSQCNFSGPATQSPKWNANLTSEFGFGLRDGADGFVRGLGTYTPDYIQDPANTLDNVKAYALLNLYAGIRDPDGGWELSLFAKNVFNTQRVLGRSAQPLSTGLTTLQFGPGGSVIGSASSTYVGNYYSVNTLAPRELGINLRVALGSR